MIHSALTAANDFAAVASMQLPNPAPVQPPGTNGLIVFMGWAKWVALAVCGLGIVAAGAMMAINSRRGEGSEHAGRLFGALAGVVVIGAAFSIVGFLVAS